MCVELQGKQQALRAANAEAQGIPQEAVPGPSTATATLPPPPKKAKTYSTYLKWKDEPPEKDEVAKYIAESFDDCDEVDTDELLAWWAKKVRT